MSDKLILIYTTDFDALHAPLQKQIYDQYFQLVYKMVFFMVKEHTAAEDILQEAFMRALHKPPKIIVEALIEGWLKTVTRNVAYNYLKKHKKFRDELGSESVYISEAAITQQEESVEEIVEMTSMKEAIHQYIDLLKPEHRVLMEMKLVRHLSYKEMAEELQITEGAVRQRLSRAREIIRDRLVTDWGVSE